MLSKSVLIMCCCLDKYAFVLFSVFGLSVTLVGLFIENVAGLLPYLVGNKSFISICSQLTNPSIKAFSISIMRTVYYETATPSISCLIACKYSSLLPSTIITPCVICCFISVCFGASSPYILLILSITDNALSIAPNSPC